MEKPRGESKEYDWANERGDRWRVFVEGYEGTFEPVNDLLVEAMRFDEVVPGEACRIAEVGSGGGATSLALAAAAPMGGEVSGFDLSGSLVEYARSRVGDRRITFDVADVATAQLSGPAYQRMASRFGVMFFGDEEAAFRNMRSWLHPEARFAFAVWGPMVENAWSSDVDEVARRFVTIPEPPQAGPGPERYADPQRFTDLLTRCGFSRVEADEWRGTLPVAGGVSSREAAQFVLSAFAGISQAIDEAGTGTRALVEEALTERWTPFLVDGAVRVPAVVHVIHGRAGG